MCNIILDLNSISCVCACVLVCVFWTHRDHRLHPFTPWFQLVSNYCTVNPTKKTYKMCVRAHLERGPALTLTWQQQWWRRLSHANLANRWVCVYMPLANMHHVCGDRYHRAHRALLERPPLTNTRTHWNRNQCATSAGQDEAHCRRNRHTGAHMCGGHTHTWSIDRAAELQWADSLHRSWLQ